MNRSATIVFCFGFFFLQTRSFVFKMTYVPLSVIDSFLPHRARRLSTIILCKQSGCVCAKICKCFYLENNLCFISQKRTAMAKLVSLTRLGKTEFLSSDCVQKKFIESNIRTSVNFGLKFVNGIKEDVKTRLEIRLRRNLRRCSSRTTHVTELHEGSTGF